MTGLNYSLQHLPKPVLYLLALPVVEVDGDSLSTACSSPDTSAIKCLILLPMSTPSSTNLYK